MCGRAACRPGCSGYGLGLLGTPSPHSLVKCGAAILRNIKNFGGCLGKITFNQTGAGMDRHIIFKCPHTGLNVQHALEAPSADSQKDSYRSIYCPACTRIHFIHHETGKLLGEK